MPVQPMKTIAAAALSSHPPLTVPQISAAAISTATVLLLLGSTRLMSLLYRFLPLPIVRGVQLSQGLSFSFTALKYIKIMPFFETLNYWGIHWKRTRIKCSCCGRHIGYVYDDGPPLTDSPGQFHFGPSQAIPRAPRYRFKNKAILIKSET